MLGTAKAATEAALRAKILRWYGRNGRDLPWRRTRDPYRILVSEIMLQQTQVDRVIPKFHAFIKRFPSARSLARAPLGDVLREWSGLGYNARARRLWLCARELTASDAVRLGREPDRMRGLPGIGRYTAGAIACFAFDATVPVVDTNVRRVLSRAIAGVDDVGERAAWEIAQRALPRRSAARWHHALMDIGALFCKASPRCASCPVRDACRYRAAGKNAGGRGARRPASRPRQSTYLGSRRYFRGRAIEALARARSLNFAALGEQVRPGFEETDLPWLLDLLHELRADGLVAIDERRSRARLP